MAQSKSEFLIFSGIALATGGALTILINAIVTPLIDTDASYAVNAATAVFIWRQSLATVATLALLCGTVGLYIRHADRFGRLGVIAFQLAFIGCAFAFATEWSQVFFIYDVARTELAVLEKLDAADGPSLGDVGTMITLLTFAVGWILFASVLLGSNVYKKRGPILIISGFVAIPLLGSFLGVWGAIVGNAVLGSGWLLLGFESLSFGLSGPLPHEQIA